MWLYWRRSLRKRLRLNKFIRIEPLSGRSGVLVQRERNIRSLSLPWEDIARRELPTGQEDSFYQNPTMLAPWSWTPSLQNYKKVNLCFWSHPIYSILLQLPNLTDTWRQSKVCNFMMIHRPKWPGKSNKWKWNSLSHVWLWDPRGCSPPGSSVCEILQARILGWAAISFTRGSSQPRDQAQVSCLGGRFFIIRARREAHKSQISIPILLHKFFR